MMTIINKTAQEIWRSLHKNLWSMEMEPTLQKKICTKKPMENMKKMLQIYMNCKCQHKRNKVFFTQSKRPHLMHKCCAQNERLNTSALYGVFLPHV